MKSSVFTGCMPALMTPCTPDRRPDFEALVRKGQELIAKGMSAVIYCGSMGDWPLLTDEERMTGVEALVRAGVPVIVGTGAVNTRLAVVQSKTSAGWQDLTGRLQRGESLPLFGLDPQPGDEFYLGFTQPLPPHEAVTLVFVTHDWQADKTMRQQLKAECERQQRSCFAPPALVNCDVVAQTPVMSSPCDTAREHHSVKLVWEYVTASGRSVRLPAANLADETRALTLNGRLAMRVPEAMKSTSFGVVREAYYYLCCRFVGGAYDAPPVASQLAFNALVAEQSVPARTNDAVSLGEGDGRPHLQLLLPGSPVVQESFELFTLEKDGWNEWQRVADFDASRRQDAHFQLDAEQGLVSFSDGEHGRVVPHAAHIYARYDVTRAEAGNLRAQQITALADTPRNHDLFGNDWPTARDNLKVTNPQAATGGQAAETLPQALGRAVELIDVPQRAVTVTDYETLARETPGVQLARVAARANLHPDFPGLTAPGVITVMVVPSLPRQRPTPSPELLQSVARYLGSRRVIGTRVEVIGPHYVEVTVRAKVNACLGVHKADLQQRINAALRQFFDPLQGGPDGTGWPFGRDVYRSEVLQVIDQTRGADHVLALSMVPDGGEPQCANLCLRPNELIVSGAHQITIV